MSMCKKAIIVAAGRGRRLGGNTDEIPKCMVRVGGRPILHWQLRALTAAGIDDIVIVRGYLGDRIDPGDVDVRFVDNPEWASNNILASLMYAVDEFALAEPSFARRNQSAGGFGNPSRVPIKFDGGFYFSYCDIVYAPAAVASLAEAAAESSAAASLIVDRRWADAYQGRDLHPVSEAELTAVETVSGASRILQVGKQAVAAANAVGEFIGLAHFSAQGAQALERIWQASLAGAGLDAPFGRAKALRQAYLTDALNAMIAAGERLAPVYIDGTWREIDTQQDLAAAERALVAWSG